MNELAGVPIWTLTPSGILALTVIFILTGRLVPRKFYDEKTEEAREWREAAQTKDEQIDELLIQLKAVSDVGATVEKIMAALPKPRDGD